MRDSRPIRAAVILIGLVSGCSKPAAKTPANSGNGAASTPQASGSSAAAAGTSGSNANGSTAAPGSPSNAGTAAASGTGGAPGASQPAAGAAGQSAPPGAATTSDAGARAMPDAALPMTLFPSVTDFEGDGPYTSRTLSNVGPNNNYAVYLPMQPPPAGAKNPIVGWMSGGGTSQSGYPLLPHLATHGFVVVASNTIPGIGNEVALGQEIIAGIDWAISENDRMGSDLYGRLDTKRIASIGYSMGSLATFTIANDPRLTTTVHISGGNMAPERVNNLHAPAAFICGIPGDSSCNILSTNCDIAAANCDTDFMNATTGVFYANFMGGHLGILTPPLSTAITGMATAWLRYKLMDDGGLQQRFVGPSCTYCTDSAWKVQQKNLP